MPTAPRRLDWLWRRAPPSVGCRASAPAPAGLAELAPLTRPVEWARLARLARLARRADVAALAAAVVLAQVAATAPVRAAASELPLHLREAADGARLELPTGELVSLALPPGARLDAAAPLSGGWIAAGTAPAAGNAGGASGTGGAGGGGRDLLLLAGGTRPGILPPPGERIGKLLAEPLPLVAGGRLAGLAWLEGDDPRALGVRYAAWNGGGWSAPRTISAPGQGSQLALAACRLADGSWLLAWSAFDGHDDEIVWSAGGNGNGTGTWTPPRKLTVNRVPDITPVLAPAGGGALIAWSQLAGDGYRLLVARYRDGLFGEPVVAAPGGSLYPSFETSPGTGRLRLLYRTAEPRGWAALELDAGGRPRRVATAPDPPPQSAEAGGGGARGGAHAGAVAGALDRPSLAGDGNRAIFSWPGGGPERTSSWQPWQPPATAPAAAVLGNQPGDRPVDRRERRPRRGAAGQQRAPAVPLDASPQAYVAFGDSITSGFGDPKGIGYPGRLEALLTTDLNVQVTVINDGMFGETTGEGLTRIGSALQPGVTAVLLMEGTNDINAKVSIDTIVQNLDLMAGQAETAGIAAVHATIIPRLKTADTDPTNVITASLAGAVRELAWERSRTLADPFEVFFYLTPDAMSLDYLGGGDKLHPNGAGYDLLAQTFADALTSADHVPPVIGTVSPGDGQQNVPANVGIQLDVLDFGAGIDVANTHLLIKGQAVAVTPTGDQRRLQFLYQPPAPLAGVVSIGLQAQDLATPPNTFTGTVSTFEVVGTFFLPGDLNHDGIVDGQDLLLFAPCFGAHRYDPNFQLACDLNGDGIVDGRDLAILAFNFGKRSF
ncbi:MAG TPA: GDSL-type esterase/lipase family protein [Thermoanaerobaculia bacterium]|nr:GDSL-type esterase/lipase family protein [Thermoanaerobaculia bacterium]